MYDPTANLANRQWWKAVQRCLYDPKKPERIGRQMCVKCFYMPRIGMAVMTRGVCGKCGVETMFGSSVKDKLCHNCGESTKSCVRCGSFLNFHEETY